MRNKLFSLALLLLIGWYFRAYLINILLANFIITIITLLAIFLLFIVLFFIGNKNQITKIKEMGKAANTADATIDNYLEKITNLEYELYEKSQKAALESEHSRIEKIDQVVDEIKEMGDDELDEIILAMQTAVAHQNSQQLNSITTLNPDDVDIAKKIGEAISATILKKENPKGSP